MVLKRVLTEKLEEQIILIKQSIQLKLWQIYKENKIEKN